jgi:hypothetical protein
MEELPSSSCAASRRELRASANECAIASARSECDNSVSARFQARRISLGRRSSTSRPDDLVGEGFADPKSLGDLSIRQALGFIDANRLFVKHARSFVRDSPKALRKPAGGVGPGLRTRHAADARESCVPSFHRRIYPVLHIAHPTSVQALIVQRVDVIVHPLYDCGYGRPVANSSGPGSQQTDRPTTPQWLAGDGATCGVPG